LVAHAGLRRTVAIVALLNLAYFGVEFGVAKIIGSVSLFADSIDFLEDASVNLLIASALGFSLRNRARIGMLLSLVLLAPAVAFALALWHKLHVPLAPLATPLTATGAGALGVNLLCAVMLARYRDHAGSLTRAAFLSARNDALANVAIIGAGAITAFTGSPWPDVVVGVGIALMNLDAAREIWATARGEHRLGEA
jgi:Co/Zn/Cd efflux system component